MGTKWFKRQPSDLYSVGHRFESRPANRLSVIFIKFLHANAGLIRQIRPGQLPSKYQIRCSLISLPLDAI
jgi:hypothetical protein